MHRVHHSIRPDEHDSNYGFNLSIGDRLFHTYRAEPRDGLLGMTIGLDAREIFQGIAAVSVAGAKQTCAVQACISTLTVFPASPASSPLGSATGIEAEPS